MLLHTSYSYEVYIFFFQKICNIVCTAFLCKIKDFPKTKSVTCYKNISLVLQFNKYIL